MISLFVIPVGERAKEMIDGKTLSHLCSNYGEEPICSGSGNKDVCRWCYYGA